MTDADTSPARWASSRLRTRSGPVMVEIDGEGVVYDPERETTHLLNSSALLVWSLLDGESSVAEIAAEIADAAQLPTDAVVRDVAALVGKLHEQGLIEEVGEAADCARGPVGP